MRIMVKYGCDFVVITALKKEFKQLLNVVTELNGKYQPIKGKLGIYMGELPTGGKSLRFCAAHQKKMGMVSAAILSTQMIRDFKPKYIVMLGFAATAIPDEERHCSVLIADYVANYEEGKITDEGFLPDGTGLPLDPIIKENMDHYKDEIIDIINDALIKELQKENNKWGLNIADLPKGLHVYTGPVVSGSSVVNCKKIVKQLKGRMRNIVGVEMEGVGIFQATNEENSHKAKPILIKSISDYADGFKDKRFQPLAAYTSAKYFLNLALKFMVPGEKYLSLAVSNIPLQDQDKRESKRLNSLLDNAKKGQTVKFVSITAKSTIAPYVPTYVTVGQKSSFKSAVERGVKFEGIVLNPEGIEAEIRSQIESKGEAKDKTLLFKDANEVKKKLKNIRGTVWEKNLEVRYSKIGLAFKLWLFDEIAFIEPYHLGRLYNEQNALCGFSHLWANKMNWIKEGTPEYKVLVDHFDNLWKEASDPYWP